jgi:hypothetical protein
MGAIEKLDGFFSNMYALIAKALFYGAKGTDII